MNRLEKLTIKIFADGADTGAISELAEDPMIKGFTTNPTLMRAAGVTDYEAFARRVLAVVPEHPVSFEVLADDFDAMEEQARCISSWGENVYVKIPVTTTDGTFAGPLISHLAKLGVKLNVTAVMTTGQVSKIAKVLDPETPSVVSVFAGRVADTGIDPVPLMSDCVDILKPLPDAELLWASPRELLNIFQADEIGCHIITVTNDLLKKLRLVGKDLAEYSLETVEMFYRDAKAAEFTIVPARSQAAE